MKEEDHLAKNGMIRAFFDDLEERAAFLTELNEMGRSAEAMTLCCVYLDGVANLLSRRAWHGSKDPDSRRNFIRLFRDVGASSFFMAVHPATLWRRVRRWDGERADMVVEVLEGLDQDTFDGYLDEDEAAALFEEQLDPATYQWLRHRIADGTVAAMVYDLLRVPSVHSLGAPGAIAFGSKTFKGGLIGWVSFEQLFDVLEDAISYARGRSEDTGRWFGHG